MTAVEPVTHIKIDDRGVAWIAQTQVKVIEVIMDWLANQSSPEEMRHQHPGLSLAQIHAAMAYYYDHAGEMERQIKRTIQLSDDLLAQSANQPGRDELLARLKSK